jgi:hypothetical protein
VNPVEIEQDIRRLELMLTGGAPARQTANFGRDEVGLLDSVKSRAPEVRLAPSSHDTDTTFVLESYVITDDGRMRVEAPSRPAT